MIVGSTMFVADVDPFSRRRAIVRAGISVRCVVLSARNITIALVAVFLCGLSSCRCFIACSPSGVAALPRPSRLADMFMTMAPIAGWSGGTSGNSRTSTGRKARAIRPTRPAFSATRMIPVHSASTPTSPSASRAASAAPSRVRVVRAFIAPPTGTAPTTSAGRASRNRPTTTAVRMSATKTRFTPPP